MSHPIGAVAAGRRSALLVRRVLVKCDKEAEDGIVSSGLFPRPLLPPALSSETRGRGGPPPAALSVRRLPVCSRQQRPLEREVIGVCMCVCVSLRGRAEQTVRPGERRRRSRRRREEQKFPPSPPYSGLLARAHIYMYVRV
jgi:hypothetical protein